jgi:hypothetical protein
MASKFKKGDVVTAKFVVPSGPVESIRMDDDGEVFYLISWNDLEGTQHQRWFSEEQLTT